MRRDHAAADVTDKVWEGVYEVELENIGLILKYFNVFSRTFESNPEVKPLIEESKQQAEGERVIQRDHQNFGRVSFMA